MGAHGLYYRATLPVASSAAQAAPQIAPTPSHKELTEIESGAVCEMQDSSSSKLLSELDEKRKKAAWFPLAVVAAGLVLVAVLASGSQPAVAGAIFLAGLVVSWAAKSRDELAKTTVLLYELEPDAERAYQQLHDAIDELNACAATWHVEAEGAVTDRKRHAGASSVMRRKSIQVAKGAPPFVKTNVSLPSIPVGRQTLWFFPDRLLVFESAGVGAVSYDEVKVERRATRFIEDGTVPRDSEVVGKTWKYVNKQGGPDKRFKDNRELPIALYEEVHFTSGSGLNEVVQVSRNGAGTSLEVALRGIAGLGVRAQGKPAG